MAGSARDDRAILGEVTRKLLDEQFLGEVAIRGGHLGRRRVA